MDTASATCNSLVNSISDRVDQFHVEVYRLSLYGAGIRYIEEETSLFNLFNTLKTSTGDLPLAVAFTVQVLKKFGFTNLTELTRYAAPDFNMASSYPKADLLLTVTSFLCDLDGPHQNERKNTLALISSSYMNDYKFPKDLSSYNMPKNVKAMFDKGVIAIGNVSAFDRLARLYRPAFFDEYKKRTAGTKKGKAKVLMNIYLLELLILQTLLSLEQTV